MSPARALTSMAPWSRTDIRVARAMCVCVFACGQLETSRLPLPLSELKAQRFSTTLAFTVHPTGGAHTFPISSCRTTVTLMRTCLQVPRRPSPRGRRASRIRQATATSHIWAPMVTAIQIHSSHQNDGARGPARMSTHADEDLNRGIESRLTAILSILHTGRCAASVPSRTRHRHRPGALADGAMGTKAPCVDGRHGFRLAVAVGLGMGLVRGLAMKASSSMTAACRVPRRPSFMPAGARGSARGVPSSGGRAAHARCNSSYHAAERVKLPARRFTCWPAASALADCPRGCRSVGLMTSWLPARMHPPELRRAEPGGGPPSRRAVLGGRGMPLRRRRVA